jgi:hypothetical protein
MKKKLLRIMVLTVVLVLSLAIAAPALATTPMPGAIWTTNSLGVKVDQNLYAAKTDVYLNGGPASSSAPGLPAGNYYVKVTTPGGTMLGKSLTASVAVGASGRINIVQLWSLVYRTSTGYTVLGYDNTTSNGGEYKVWVSQTNTFPDCSSKTDTFKVKPILGTIIVKKNTTGRNDTFDFTGIGGNGLPASFSITTASNTGFVIYDVTPGDFGVTEIVGGDWILEGSSIVYGTTVAASAADSIDVVPADCHPWDFPVGKGQIAIVTFCNKEKCNSTTTTKLSADTIKLGESVTDEATVTGSSTKPTGTVTFQVSTDGGATFATFGAVKTLVNGKATSDSYTPAAGSADYRFRALYSGDAKYKASLSGDQEEPLTVTDEATIIVVKNTNGGDSIFDFTATGGNGLPADFSITTSGNTGTVTYTVKSGTYGIVETVDTGWELTSNTTAPVSAGLPDNFTLAPGDTVTVTFNNKAKPDEPLPELPSALLFGLGILSVGGFVALKKHAKAITNK